MPETTPTSPDTGNELANSVSASLMQGRKQADIIKDLVKQGVPENEAAPFVAEVARGIEDFKKSPEYKQARRARGRKHLLVGSLWCIGGTAVTIATFSAARNGGGYVVAWGAIIFGAIEAIAGLFMMLG